VAERYRAPGLTYQRVDEILVEELRRLSSLTERMLRELESMSFVPREVRKFTWFTYPPDGTKRTLPKGTTVIDFYTGKVTLPDGTREITSGSLMAIREPLMHSLALETNQAIRVQLDDYGKHPVDANDYLLLTWVNFSRVTIYTDMDTKVAVFACTNPEAVLRKVGSLAVRGLINTYNVAVDPLAEYGTPRSPVGRYSGTDTTYQELVSWTVPTNYYGVLREVSMTSDPHAQFKLEIGGVTQFEGMTIEAPLAIPYPPNKLPAGTVVRLSVRSDDGTSITVNGSISAKEVPA